MNEKPIKLIVTGAVVTAVHTLFGMPIAGSVVASLLTQSTCDILLPQLREWFFNTDDGILNYDIQKALIQALRDALKDIDNNYSHPSAATKRLFSDWQDSIQEEKLIGQFFEENVLTFFQKDAPKTPEIWEQFDLQPYLDGDWGLESYIKQNLPNRIQYQFKQALKSNEKARIAVEMMISEALMELGISNIQLTEKVAKDLDVYGTLWVTAIRKFNDKLEEILKNQKEQATAKQVEGVNEKVELILQKTDQQIISQKNLTPPPNDPTIFIGRTETLKDIHQRLQNQQNLMLISGIGGVGKTAILQKYWHTDQVQDTYKHLAWCTVLTDLPTALLALEPAFKIEPKQGQKIAERFAEVKRQMANVTEQPCLLVLDNANDTDDLHQHYFTLPNWHIVISSRTTVTLNNLEPYPIEVLPMAEAQSLFYTYYPKAKTQTELLHDLLVAIGRHTLSIELLAKNLAAAKGKYSLEELRDDLAKNGILKLSTSKKIRTDYYRKNAIKPEVLILLMFDIQPLSETEQWLLLQFAVLPSIEISHDFLLEIFKEKEEQVEENLDTLVEKGWLSYKEKTERYQLHPVVQEVAKEKLKPITYKKCKELVEFFLDKIVEEYREEPLNTAQYVSYANSLVQSIVEEHAKIAILTSNLATIYNALGDLQQALKFHIKAIDMLEKIHKQNPNYLNLAIFYNQIARTYQGLGEFEKALEFQNKDIQIKEYIYRTNSPKLFESYNNLQTINQDLERFDQDLQEEINTYSNKSTDEKKQAGNYNNQGTHYLNSGHPDKALVSFNKAKDIYEKIHSQKPNHSDLPIVYKNIAQAHLALKQLKEAGEFITKAYRIEEVIHKENPKHQDLALTHFILTEICWHLKMPRSARSHINQAVSIYQHNFPDGHPHLTNALSWQKGIDDLLGKN